MTDGSRRRSLLLTLLLVLVVSLLGHTSASADDDDDDDLDEELEGVTEIVVKVNRVQGATIAQVNEAFQTTTVDTVLASRGIYLVRPTSGADEEELEAVTERMEFRPDLVVYAEPNFSAEAPEGNPRFRRYSAGGPTLTGSSPDRWRGQYGVAQLGLATAHEVSEGAGATVAVLDTGVQAEHPFLAGRIGPGGYDYVDDDHDPSDTANGIDDDGDGHVDEGYRHGTHVAGVVVLTAPRSTILPMRVLDSDGRGDVFLAAEALFAAAAAGADVVSMSFGTSAESDVLEEALEAGEDGTVFVASSGNAGDAARNYPAAEDDVLAVTAVDAADVRPEWATYGRWVDVAAPGVAVNSQVPVDGFADWDGTSMATPWVAGQAALLASRHPSAEADDLGEHIRATATAIGQGTGAGRVRVGVALTTALDDLGGHVGAR